jgi:hypothetical protein
MNRTPGGSGIEEAARELTAETASNDWVADYNRDQNAVQPDTFSPDDFTSDTHDHDNDHDHDH